MDTGTREIGKKRNLSKTLRLSGGADEAEKRPGGGEAAVVELIVAQSLETRRRRNANGSANAALETRNTRKHTGETGRSVPHRGAATI